MNIPNKLEETRIYSLLSEQIHYVEVEGKRYACFCGNIIPYAMIGAILIWAWTGSKVYYSVYRESNMAEIIKSLNQHDEKIMESPGDASWILSRKLAKVMKNWDEKHFDSIFEQALV